MKKGYRTTTVQWSREALAAWSQRCGVVVYEKCLMPGFKNHKAYNDLAASKKMWGRHMACIKKTAKAAVRPPPTRRKLYVTNALWSTCGGRTVCLHSPHGIWSPESYVTYHLRPLLRHPTRPHDIQKSHPQTVDHRSVWRPYRGKMTFNRCIR